MPRPAAFSPCARRDPAPRRPHQQLQPDESRRPLQPQLEGGADSVDVAFYRI